MWLENSLKCNVPWGETRRGGGWNRAEIKALDPWEGCVLVTDAYEYLPCLYSYLLHLYQHIVQWWWIIQGLIHYVSDSIKLWVWMLSDTTKVRVLEFYMLQCFICFLWLPRVLFIVHFTHLFGHPPRVLCITQINFLCYLAEFHHDFLPNLCEINIWTWRTKSKIPVTMQLKGVALHWTV